MIHARQYLFGKEICYLRTVIVTANVPTLFRFFITLLITSQPRYNNIGPKLVYSTLPNSLSVFLTFYLSYIYITPLLDILYTVFWGSNCTALTYFTLRIILHFLGFSFTNISYTLDTGCFF
jgi:hypothetical protein